MLRSIPLPFSDQLKAAALRFVEDYRGVFVTIFVLPLSLCYDLFFKVRAWLIMLAFSAPKLHQSRVKDVQNQILEIRKRHGEEGNDLGGTAFQLCTARPGWLSVSPSYREYKQRSQQVRVDLYDILELDETKQTVKVEPQVNMGQLSHFLVKKGLTIPVLPEMDDLTVGGLYMGVGIETSSHKYGLFNDCVVEAEVVLSDGTLVRCSETENKDLFDALPWSYGTLGFLVSCTIKVIPCKPYVRIQYIPCHSRKESVSVFREESEKENPADFVEALAFSENEMVVMPATFADKSEVSWSKQNTLSMWYKPWFYTHVKQFLRRSDVPPEGFVEFIPLRDYYHRHTRSIFWELADIIPFGNNFLFRLLLGWAVPPKVSFLKLTQTESLQKAYSEKHVIQDMMVPIDKMSSALQVFHDKYQIYPLWVCPYRAYDYSKTSNYPGEHRYFLRKPQNCLPGKNYEMYVDLGAYGTPQCVRDKKPFDAEKVGREVEQFVESIHGFQMLYADSYLTRDEFRRMFNHSHYDQMKQKYDPEGGFPEIYGKTCKKAAKLWAERARNKTNNNHGAHSKPIPSSSQNASTANGMTKRR